MNQDQRKFLITEVENTCREQVDKLKDQIPVEPSLNNYLIASFLDNTIEFANLDLLKKQIREEVLKMGAGDVLIKKRDSYRFRNRSDDEDDIVEVKAENLFVIPQAYKDALAIYEAKKAEVENKIKDIENASKTIIIKIQIGSSAVLDRLIAQADNMGDLNLVNAQLAITDQSQK
jgi:hypothetical protein